MVKDKLISIRIIVLLVGLGVFIFLYFNEKSERLLQESKFLKEHQKELRELRYKHLSSIDSISKVLKNTYIELTIEQNNIKYKPYEKFRYIDRNVDAALDTISKYHFN
mgnify:CR=1 FL=1|tara:strand:- start:187 stop:510 length:324 start_codon:yes stop_codon:yes gene_type:complete